MVLNPTYLYTSIEILFELRAKRAEEKFYGAYNNENNLMCLFAFLREVEFIISIDGGWKNHSFVVLNLCQNQFISVKSACH